VLNDDKPKVPFVLRYASQEWVNLPAEIIQRVPKETSVLVFQRFPFILSD